MNDILSAASLFLAIVGVLYGAWYKEIADATATKIPIFEEDRETPLREVTRVYRTKALPLAISAVLLLAVLLPDAVSLACRSAQFYLDDLVSAIGAYSAVHTLFAFVVLLSGLLAWEAVGAMWRLRALRRRLAKVKQGPED